MSSPRSREAAAPRPPAVALSWPGKEDAWAADEVGEAAPRLIAEDGAVWEGARAAENLLIMGDSLRALSALGMSHHAAIRCAYLDPPFNTGVPFADYGDRDDHGRWLAAMAACARRVRRLLRADGSLWFHLDDHEVHYMKVLLDEIFGRDNFVASVVWQRVFAKKNKALISGSHDTILVYARDLAAWRRNLLPRDARQRRAFKNPDADPRGPWQSVSYSVRSEGAERRAAYRYPIALPAGGFVDPPAGRHWNGLPERTAGLRADGRLWFGVRGDRAPRLKVFLSEVQGGIVPDSWWPHELCGSNQEAKRELLRLFPGEEPFITPKPERLLARILGIASDPGDLVLDPFAGSGTTGAVAHKLGRRWVMIERNEASYRRIAARLRRVIDGEDPGGISEAAGWGGGGDLRGLRVEGTDRPGGRGEAAIRPVGGVADQ